MRILQFTTSYPVGEADPTAPFVRSIALALASLGHELHIIAPQRETGATSALNARGVTVHWVRYAPLRALNVIGHGRSLKNDMRLGWATYVALPFFAVAALVKAAQIVHRWKPEIVHSNWVLPSGLLGALVSGVAGVPHVVSLHGSDIFIARSRGAYRFIAGWVLRNAQRVIASSPYLAEQAIALGADPERAHFLPYGVDVAVFHESDAGHSAENRRIVLAVGRLVEKKGFRMLVEHAGGFLASHPQAELWIAGEGDDRATLEATISRRPAEIAGRIKLLGRIDWSSMPMLLSLASIFVMPSIRDSAGNEDGLPTVILEAMASGKAVVATDIGGASSVIKNGRTGVIVPAGDGTELARAIGALLSDPAVATRMGGAAAMEVKTRHTWDAYARAIERFYSS
jgi:glycosyltransferase involved in cell wall biosynthesis